MTQKSKLTKSEKTLFRFYYRKSLVPSNAPIHFRMSLDQIATETGLGRATVQRGNNKFRELGILDWCPGRSLGYGEESEYVLPAAVVAQYRARKIRNTDIPQLKVWEEHIKAWGMTTKSHK